MQAAAAAAVEDAVVVVAVCSKKNYNDGSKQIFCIFMPFRFMENILYFFNDN